MHEEKENKRILTCIPPKNEKDPRWRFLFTEVLGGPCFFSFIGDNLDRIAPTMTEPNLASFDTKSHKRTIWMIIYTFAKEFAQQIAYSINKKSFTVAPLKLWDKEARRMISNPCDGRNLDVHTFSLNSTSLEMKGASVSEGKKTMKLE